MAETCGDCINRKRGQCLVHGGKVAARQDAGQCRDYARRVSVDDLPPGLRKHVARFERLSDGRLAIQLRASARHSSTVRLCIYRAAGLEMAPPRRLSLPEQQTEQQPAPRRQAGGRAA